ncbi:hypothetical protein HHK36_022413 [Tetracentron sinense]|uniref:BHLH domain-containing protein n=1 Tax=Tetracentron sinense TaxID=13715 RepID=A0A835D8T3_TETSI|nr:hypothetical protein HHK36_022413 [Tetracentron sinense]
MNYCVPDFEMNDDDSIPTPEDELVELLWQNGQVVMQSQNQRSFKKCSQKFPAEDAVIPAEVSTAMEARAFADVNEEAANQLFIQEDEMASWLHYPADDSFERDFCTDLLYPSPPGNYASSCRSSLVQEDRRSEEKSPAISRPPIPPTRRMELDSSMKIHNFKHFSRPKSKTESGPSISDKAVRESTVVDSSETPVFRPGSVGKSPMAVSGGNLRYGSMNGDAGAAGMVREFAASEPAVMSSSGGSGARASFSAEPSLKPPADDKKRKAREADYNDCQSEDVDFESIDAKKQVRGSTSSRRTRAAEVHNLSERKRRDRINEKMKALQELIPRCNKASMHIYLIHMHL